METRKLSLPTDQRNPMLRGLVTDLLWHGKIETTLAQAKAVSRLADKYITVKVQYTPVTNGTSTGYEMTTYVKKPGGEFILMAKTDLLTQRSGYFWHPLTNAGYNNDLCIVLGSSYLNNSTAAKPAFQLNVLPEKSEQKDADGNVIWRINHVGQNQIDGDKVKAFQYTHGIIYLDNFVVFEGNGDMPEGFVGAFLPTDTGAELE